MARKQWTPGETRILIENYNTKTAKELETLLPRRSRESINNKIKRLKAQGKIAEGKSDDAVQRAYEQRGKEVFFTVDQSGK